MVVDAVFGIRRDRVAVVQPPRVRLVLAEQGRWRGCRPGRSRRAAQAGRTAGARSRRRCRWSPPWPAGSRPSPSPRCCGTSAVGSTCSVSASGPALVTEIAIKQVLGTGLGVARLDDPVPVVVEGPGVQQLVFGLEPVPPGVLVDQVLIGERALRIVVAPPVPRVARDRVQVPPVLLDVLAVITLRPGQPEGPLLQDRVAAVPQRQAEAEPLRARH